MEKTHVPSSLVEDKITTTQEHYTTAYLSFSEEREAADSWRSFPRIHRVHSKLRGQHQMYDPAVLSLGPYHHGKPEFRQTEEFKTELLNMFVLASKGQDVKSLYEVIFRRIGEIRRHYDEVEWGDEKLAWIILRDTCFLIQWTENSDEVADLIIERLGASMAVIMSRDMYMLENQIPYCVITQLCDKRFDRPGMNNVLSTLYFMDQVNPVLEPEGSCKKRPHYPLHFLEAYRTNLIGHESTSVFKLSFPNSKNTAKPPAFLRLTDHHSAFHSAAYLQKRGIDFKPSDDKFFCFSITTRSTSTATSKNLRNIKFTPGFFGGTLWLPICSVNMSTTAIYSNIIAFELSSPGKRTENTVIASYVNLMKSLIVKPEDIKVLQERGILYSSLSNDEEVVKVFHEIETSGVGNLGTVFAHVIESVNKHCSSHRKRWIAELNYKYFKSPWTAMALFAATLMLILTFLQTLFTIMLPYEDKSGKNS